MVRQITYVCLALMLALAGGLFAQGVQTATVTGTVTGPDGAPLPGVTVTASSSAQLGERTAVTGSNGEYIIRGLTPGDYTLRFHLEGMQQVDRPATLQLGLTARVDAALSMTAATETIVVTGETPTALETTTVGANITKAQVDTLPVVRTPTGIADLAGAVTSRTPVAGQVSINGGLAYDNNFLINGVNVQDPIFGSTNNLFIEDAILETQVLTSGISAEYGAFTGGVLNVITKSGGNEFSGSLRGDFTKPNWRDETPWEDGFRGDGVTRATPTKREGSVGEVYTATLGGPFIRDRLWFFAAVRDEENTSPVPTPVSGNIPRVISNRRIEGKLTGNITSNHTLQASYIENPVEATHEVQVAPLTLDAIGLNSKRVNDGTVLNYTGVLTSSLFAEARWSEKNFGFRGLGGTSENIFDSPIRALAFHAMPSAGTYNAPYFDATDPEDRNNESIYGALSYFLGTRSLGNHDIKAGVERFTVTRTGGNSQTSTDYVFYTGYEVAGGAPVVTNGRLSPVFTPYPGGANGYSIMGWWISTRGAVLDITTDSFFINDRWDFNPNWSFSLGVRHEIVDSTATGEITPVDTSTTVPRLGLSFDPFANGRFKFDATYAEYAGRYNPAISGENTPVGNPASLFGYYAGPAGSGRDFAPGFDPANYVIYEATVPTANVFMEEGLSSPVQEEFTLSAGMALPKGGWLKATYVDRNLTGVIDDFILVQNGCTDIVFQGVDAGCFDNVVYDNTNGPKREYQAIELQSRYSITPNWSVEGNYTHQLKNDGNYEGEGGQAIGATPFGDRPELQSPRNNPTGRLQQFQAHKVRLWTNYNFNLGRAGSLTTGLIYRYDSAQVFNFSQGGVPLTDAQKARNPGYAVNVNGLTQTLFFGERGAGEYNDTSQFDLSLSYGIPVFRRVEPWIKFDVRNVLNDDTLITFNTAISRNTAPANCGGSACPVDELGLPTTYRQNATFGRPTGIGSYTTPREFLVSAGLRF
jgi:outer membrane receptor protein involved in Fe transport